MSGSKVSGFWGKAWFKVSHGAVQGSAWGCDAVLTLQAGADGLPPLQSPTALRNTATGAALITYARPALQDFISTWIFPSIQNV